MLQSMGSQRVGQDLATEKQQQYEISKIVKFIELKNRMVIAGGWRRRKWELLIRRHKVSVKQED